MGRADRPPVLASAATTALLLLPVAAARHLPLLDAPGHEARLSILRDVLFAAHGSPFYDPGSFLIPNLAFDGIGLLLTGLCSPEAAGRVFIGLTLVLTLWGLLVLNRVTTGRWSRAPLVTGLLLYNLVTLFGFFSYLFGLASIPWVLAARSLLPESRPGLGFVVGACLGIALLFCHELAFGVYATFSAGRILAARAGGRIRWRSGIARGLELLPPVGLFLGMAHGTPATPLYEAHLLPEKLLGILEALSSGSRIGDLALTVGVIAFAALLASSARVAPIAGLGGGLAALLLLYLSLPLAMGSAANIDKRIPIAVALLGLACLDIRLQPSVISRALVFPLGVSLVAKQAALTLLWLSFDPRIDAIVAALRATPPGAIIMQSECRPGVDLIAQTYAPWQPSLAHVAALADLDDRRFIASSWANAGQQPIAVRPSFRVYRQLQLGFARLTCDAAVYRAELARIRLVPAAKSGDLPIPVYFLLIRPALADSLTAEATLRASGRDFELYAVSAP